MLTLLNSESLWIGTDMKLFNKLREQLEQVGITYKHKVKKPHGPVGRGRDHARQDRKRRHSCRRDI